MIAAAGVVWMVVIGLLIHTGRTRPDRLREVGRRFVRNGRIFVGVVPLALIAAGFLAPLVPTELVGNWLGDGTGAAGIFIAMLAGWCLPVPPVVFFPIMAVLLKAGAGIPQLVALIAAWNVFALHRTLPMELPLMGRYFVILRLLSSLFIPVTAGFLAIAIVGVLGLGG